MKRIFYIIPLLLLALSCTPAFAADWIGEYCFIARDAAGNEKWSECQHNALANEGQQEMLSVYLQGGTAPTAYAIGLSNMAFAKTTTYATITGEPSGNPATADQYHCSIATHDHQRSDTGSADLCQLSTPGY